MTASTLPICERLRAPAFWCCESDEGHPGDATALVHEAADLIQQQQATIEAIYEAGNALIADVRRRYPGEELRCEYMRALDAALTLAREGAPHDQQ